MQTAYEKSVGAHIEFGEESIMAHEIRGILLETVVEAALQRALSLIGISGELRWNQRPEGMSITPDLTVGADKNEPSHIVLVTASGAEHNSHMKMWRNLGEIFEGKIQLPTQPRLISVYGISRMKEYVRSIMDSLPDASLHLDEKTYGEDLLQWILENQRSAPTTNQAKRDLLEADLARDDDLANALDLFAQDLSQALQQENVRLARLWHLMRTDYQTSPTPPAAQTTRVRRGLGKLLVLEPRIRHRIYEIYDKSRGVPVEEIPDYAFRLGLFRRTLVGARIDDEEIIDALNLLRPETCERLIDRVPENMQPWIYALRQLENVPKFLDFVDSNFNAIIDPDRLYDLLAECQNDPEIFAKARGIGFSGNLSRNWLFSFLMDLIKASTGKVTGFGYARLAGEIGESTDVSSGYITIADWANRVPDVELPESVLRSVATVLANRVQSIGRPKLPKLSNELIEITKKSFLEIRILPYRNFDPLLWLLETELESQDKSYIPRTPYKGWINEFTEVGRKSATTPFLCVESTLIHWRSSHGSHTNDKTKELSARARNVRYQYHPITDNFTHREGVEQLALIVDGDWTDKNLKALSEAGWDIIVYPDEIEALVKQLK